MGNENEAVFVKKENNGSCSTCDNCRFIPFNGIKTYICKILECCVSLDDCCYRYKEKGSNNV